MGHGGDAVAELTVDHREVDELFEQIEKAEPGSAGRKQLVDQLTIELVRHSVAEEAYLYPAVREHLAGGDALADQEIADHGRVEALLKDLEGCAADHQSFDQLVDKLKFEVKEHVADEEGNLFVQMRAACSADDLMALGDDIRKAKKLAPTRPHPGAPSTPPGNKLLAPGLGLVDRARDFVTGRGK